MSSSPSSKKQRSPKRTSPRRTPLREQTPSRSNEISLRLGKEARSQETLNIYNANPFPTKASQVLLPSTVRRKKSIGISPNSENFGFLSDSDAGTSSVSKSSQGSRPTVKLKRSVKALRDLYEAQAEESSRPSTATSPPLRPSTANSLRLRSISSSESLSGAYAWESLRQISHDDLALLPTLPSDTRAANRLSSRASFTSIAENPPAPLSPSYNVLGLTSSPRPTPSKKLRGSLLEAFEDLPSTSSGQDSSSSPNIVRLAHTSSSEQFQSTDSSSSPNVVRLGHTSSTEQFSINDGLSSPNFVKLGTSPEHSPDTARRLPSDHSVCSRSSSSSSRKRKRFETAGERTFAARVGALNPLASSPPSRRHNLPSGADASSPVEAILPSSAPHSVQQSSVVDESSPVIRVIGRSDLISDSISTTETHSSLQAALSSSPPRIQYPVVRAPPPSQHTAIKVPKRNSRSLSTDASAARFSSTLSAVPSEGSWSQTRPVSEVSSVRDDLDVYLHSDELAPASTYIINEAANQTQVRLVPDTASNLASDQQCDCECECDHHSFDSQHNEATDEVSALPISEYGYRAPALRPVQSGGHLASSSSGSNSAHHSTARLNSMKSFTQSRQNSYLRPSSSSSSIISTAPVPSWAKRYYSGVYRDSFQYLYSSGSIASLRSLAARQAPIPVSSLTPVPSRPDTMKSNANPSLRNIHQTMTERVAGLLRPTRPKLAARKSHTLPGVGPLVSNPIARVRSPPTAAHPYAHGARRQSYQHPQMQSLPSNHHNRSVSMPLSPTDPRAHWAGIVEIHEIPGDDGRGAGFAIRHHSYTYSVGGSQSDSQNQSVIYHPGGNELRRAWHRWSSSPHLHHDARLNTGSSVSRGFGFPFNSKSRWISGVPDIMTYDGQPGVSNSGLDLRSVQVFAFALGFVLPVTWIIGSFLPLPERPDSFGDIERQVIRESQQPWRQSQRQCFPLTQGQSRVQSLRNSHPQRNSRPSQERDGESGSLDILARLRLERHHAGMAELKYQNARWWRNLNRWMSIVGVVVIVLVVVLAVLGTKNWGA